MVMRLEASRVRKSLVGRVICIDMQTLPAIEAADITPRRVPVRVCVRVAVTGSCCFCGFWMIHTNILEA